MNDCIAGVEASGGSADSVWNPASCLWIKSIMFVDPFGESDLEQLASRLFDVRSAVEPGCACSVDRVPESDERCDVSFSDDDAFDESELA